jgi:ankyrin repeat protein
MGLKDFFSTRSSKGGKSGSRRKTPLHTAADNDDVGEVQRLLASGADVHARDESGNTPLRLASGVAVATALLRRGANVNERNDDGLTPLHRAAMTVHPDLLELYLSNGADVHARSDEGVTPVITALFHGLDRNVALLVEHGALADLTEAARSHPKPRARDLARGYLKRVGLSE